MSTSTRFILTHTKDASNVGAAARALKTMGFQDLVLVAPHDSNVLVHKKAIGSASGALDILKNARVVDTLPEALEGTNIWCGTGMPVDMAHARPPQRYVEPRIYFDELLLMQQQKQERMENMELQDQPTTALHGGISFVFGNERFGMTPMDLGLCHVILGIPTNPSFGSLNLASAVQLIAYDWRQALGGF